MELHFNKIGTPENILYTKLYYAWSVYAGEIKSIFEKWLDTIKKYLMNFF